MSNEVILYCAPLVLGAVVCLALAVSAWRYRHVPGALALFVLLLAISSWALSYAFEIASLDLPTKILWAKVEYLGAQTTSISWLAFCLSYTGLTGKRSWRTLQVLAVFPLLTLILAVTNEAHYLTWASTRLDTAGPVPMLVVTHGAWFWVNVASSYLFLIAGAFRIMWVVVRMPDIYRSQAGALLVAVLAPLAGNVSYILNIVPLTNLDLTPYCFLIVGAALGWGVLKFRLLSLFIGLVPAARDAIVEAMADGVVVLDAANNIADINPSAERIVGLSAKSLIGHPAAEAFKDYQQIVAAAEPGAEQHLEILLGADSAERCFDVLVTPIEQRRGQAPGRLLVFRDITERRLADEALQHLALHDSLTGLPNRNALRRQIQDTILVEGIAGSSLALLLMDLDRFREVNDTFGHHLGDALLQLVGQRLLEALGKSGQIARLGGDEFAVLLVDSTAENASATAEMLVNIFRQPFEVEGCTLDVGVSIGISLFPEHGGSADILMRRADVAMYLAKHSGNKFVVYSLEQDFHSPKQLALQGELRAAIEEDEERHELALFYQPQARFRTGLVGRTEALIRWHHPEQGLCPPDKFIPLAERTGLIRPLSQWVLGTALRQCRAWHEAGWRNGVSVNLSAVSLQDASLADSIMLMLAKCHVEPDCLTIEIAEGSLMVDPAAALRLLNTLRGAGIHIAIDDFGTGYSSLAYLARLPVDEIKIDKSFVMSMTRYSHDEAIVRSTINLGHDLGLVVVAEGVETQDAWILLKSLGCDYAQGYFLSRPVPADSLNRWLRAESRAEV